jgi:hypothetical protein
MKRINAVIEPYNGDNLKKECCSTYNQFRDQEGGRHRLLCSNTQWKQLPDQMPENIEPRIT